MKTVWKLLAALAAVAGAVYVIATYGDKIVEFAKKIWAAMPKCPDCEETRLLNTPEHQKKIAAILAAVLAGYAGKTAETDELS